ncbi:MAG TPA: phosphoenolpyruvate synthase, partial [Tissierellia bacterium]|nr:phosphoenolpyruvate synthase [Tissierellia bacterium]
EQLADHFGFEFCTVMGSFLTHVFHYIHLLPIFLVSFLGSIILFPIPSSPDGFKRLFVSAGHMQMMTDVILPLGMSFMHKVSLFRMVECGGRLFIDITHDMKTVYGKKMIHQKMAAMDPLIHRAIEQVMADKEYLASIPKGAGSFSSFGLSHWIPMLRQGIRLYRRNNPEDIDQYVERMEASVRELRQTLERLSGSEVLDAIEQDQSRLMDVIYDSTGFGAVLATQYAIGQIDRLGKQLTGESNLSNRLSKSVEHNVSSEMGLALSEVSDLIRDYPEVQSYLEESGAEFTFFGLKGVPGGEVVAQALEDFLQRYGMRATGEIDITKTRFRENPAELIPTILSNIRSLPVGHAQATFQQGVSETQKIIEDILYQAKQKLGRKKAKKLEKNITFFRHYLGTREYPKYFWICRYDVYKQALMREAKELVKQGVLDQAEDIYYLTFEELRHMMATQQRNQSLIEERKAAYSGYAHLTPPRVIFSDGEVPEIDYARQIPTGALAGLGVSSGMVEGRARVIKSIEDAVIAPGDILVTSFTDPSWTPVFVSLAGLVTEIGGMMTHGAVITREYGLPAVVGVVGATQRIKDGDLIRINGDEGYVEIL